MLESERQLIILAHGLAGCVELLLLLRGEVQLDDMRDAVATHDSGHAGVHIVLTVFAVQQNRNRKNAVLVVEDDPSNISKWYSSSGRLFLFTKSRISSK